MECCRGRPRSKSTGKRKNTYKTIKHTSIATAVVIVVRRSSNRSSRSNQWQQPLQKHTCYYWSEHGDKILWPTLTNITNYYIITLLSLRLAWLWYLSTPPWFLEARFWELVEEELNHLHTVHMQLARAAAGYWDLKPDEAGAQVSFYRFPCDIPGRMSQNVTWRCGLSFFYWSGPIGDHPFPRWKSANRINRSKQALKLMQVHYASSNRITGHVGRWFCQTSLRRLGLELKKFHMHGLSVASCYQGFAFQIACGSKQS